MRIFGPTSVPDSILVGPSGWFCLLASAEEIGLRAAVPREHPLPLCEVEVLNEKHYGRRRRHGLFGDEPPREPWESLDPRDAQEQELLLTGHMHLLSGVTGNQAGRPAEGEQDPERISAYIEQLAPDFHFDLASRDERAQVVVELLAPPWSVNVRALADLWGINRRFVYRLREHGRTLVSQNTPTRGEASFHA